jgi:hypothetical protein
MADRVEKSLVKELSLEVLVVGPVAEPSLAPSLETLRNGERTLVDNTRRSVCVMLAIIAFCRHGISRPMRITRWYRGLKGWKEDNGSPTLRGGGGGGRSSESNHETGVDDAKA